MCCHCQNSIDCDCLNCKNSNTMNQYHKNPNLLQALPSVPVRTVNEQIWDMLRANREQLLVSNVIDVVDVSYFKAKALLSSWVAAGHVRRYQAINLKTRCPEQAYELLRDCGQEPPKVDGKGKPKACSGNELVWRTLRILKICNANQIVASATDATATLNIRAVRQYLRQLHMAGYLVMLEQAQGQLAVYRLMHNTGPRAPEVQRGKKIYDGNLGMVVYDPAKPLPPSHQGNKNNSKQAKKGACHV